MKNKFRTHLAGVDEFIAACFGAESRCINAKAVNPQMHAIFLVGKSPILIACPNQVCGWALEFGAGTKSPQTLAALETAGPVVQVTGPVSCARAKYKNINLSFLN
jgi:hypothetical protein